jgi:hypothetical protein
MSPIEVKRRTHLWDLRLAENIPAALLFLVVMYVDIVR